MESRAVEELLSLCWSLQQSSMNTEMEFMEMAKSLESLRRRCFTAESELKKYKELLVKSDVAKAALEVKLKHVRNQLDLEMQKRLRVERDFQYLQRQMQLMCDILVQDSKSSSCLNEEQKSLLATFEHKNQASTIHKASKRLSVIDESSFLSHSDISYDRTDDDVDLDSTVIKPLKSRAREKRRSSMGVVSAANGPVGKRVRTSISTEIQTHIQDRMNLNKEVETIGKVSVCSPESSQSHMVVGITQEQNQRTIPSAELAPVDADQTSVWCPSEETLEPETVTRTEDFFRTNSSSSTFSNICNRTPIQTPCKTSYNINNNTNGTKHVFISKTVIRPETCYCCGKRMRFGKMVVKCRNCRVVVHPECKNKCPVGCSSIRPSPLGPQTKAGTQIKPGSLESFCPTERPRVPLLVVECISEIERRGLKERGLYRVPGGDRAVKELRERFLSGKTALNLGKVEDVHVICCLLKDFLRKLPEPLITFRLHKLFMETAEIEDERGTVILYKAISELPPPNKDTLAIILLHLHKVMVSAECHMDHSNLCRVFGPTLIGHALAEPSPTTIMRDTANQHKVMSRLLSIPVDYWKRILSHTEQTPTSVPPLVSETPTSVKTTSQDEKPSRLFKPVTSPELSSYRNRQGSITGRLRNLGHAGNVGRGDPSRRFFTSPS
ncbi:rac GTPase-activating protein 1 [Boleophthalmus pectinirostris]|uniref:rac GTPase-activating protein 1 n=1 Tax=Boleophthalmus pectinirostris TaxID=150288 RepID=UPI002432D90F|nr:rac GTPase-activating protein 1 [Boleophthalmus pectinirostris]